MKSQPESSGEDNSSKNLQSIPEPLENLCDLLAELGVEESPQKQSVKPTNPSVGERSAEKQEILEEPDRIEPSAVDKTPSQEIGNRQQVTGASEDMNISQTPFLSKDGASNRDKREQTNPVPRLYPYGHESSKGDSQLPVSSEATTSINSPIEKEPKVEQNDLKKQPFSEEPIVAEIVDSETPATSRARNLNSFPETKKVDEFKYTNKLLSDDNSTESVDDIELQSFLADFEAIDRERIDKVYDSQQWIVEKERKVRELADNIDSLLPLLVQLSQAQADNAEERILRNIVPVIDRVIKERSAEDSTTMADAIADLLPDAIRQEITNVPESIGKAIAPELALSMTEQIRLDRDAIALALGSEMGKAIKAQIEIERDAMVDALYPVIGSTISKYMAEVVESINYKVDNALSPEGITRKIRAKVQGVSEAELILKESLPCSVRAAFLIQKASGLVIREVQPDLEQPLESDLLAGMLTAIRSFAKDCIASNSELDEIDYGQFQILFETAGYCYLAVVVKGEPDRQFRDRIRKTFTQIVTQHGEAIESYQGDPETIPESVQPILEEVAVSGIAEKPKKSPKTLYWLVGILLSSILIPWGIIKYRGAVANRIERAVAVELDATPELSVYRLIPQVKKGQLTLEGRVPSPYFRDLASKVSQTIATQEKLELNNQIVAVNVPVDPTITVREITRVSNLFNQRPQVKIDTSYQENTVTVNGFILDRSERDNLLAILKNVPGVNNVILNVQFQLPNFDTKIYFPSGITELSFPQDEVKIKAIEKFLVQNPSIKLRIIGHGDRQGNSTLNLKLTRTRANNVYQALIDRGIDSQRLTVDATLASPPNLSSEQAKLPFSSRYVRFESFITSKN